jgi:hypothetical protein
MKKVVLTAVVLVLGLVGFAQTNSNAPQRLKYVTDTREDSMKLESADNFYKYEIVEPTTSEAIYASHNKGKECTIDKTKIAAGTYDLRLYTSSFVITSKITVTAARKMHSPLQPVGDIIASNE